MGIVGLLKGLDKLGHTYTLNIGDNPEKKTVLGGILWVLGVLLILAYAVNAVVSYSQREKMSTSEDTEDSYMGIPVELGQERLYPMFMVKSLTKFLEEEEVNKMFRITFELTVKNSSSVPPTYFDVVPCRQISPERIEFSKQSVENFKYFESMFQTVMFCVDPKGKKAILSGSPDGLVNTTYSNLMFKPCLSTTEGCRQDVDFRGISVSLIKVNRLQNLHNLTSPVKYFWNFEDDFYITRSKEQRLRMFLMQTEVYDQKGFPYRKELAKRFHQIEKQYRMLQDRDNLVV